MKNNWSLLMLLFLIDNHTDYCMDNIKTAHQTKKSIYKHLYALKFNDVIVNAFFNNKEYITCISHNGTAYRLNTRTNTTRTPYTISDYFSPKSPITIKEIIYNREKNHLYVITNMYCKKINGKNITRMQDILIINYSHYKDMKSPIISSPFKNEIIHFVDPNMAFVITTPFSHKSLFITHFTNEYTISSKQYFNETVKSIAFHSKKKLCALCSYKPDKSPMLRILSTKTWNLIWMIPERAENLSFSHNGEWIAYSSPQRVRMQKIQTPHTIETIIPIVAKITSLAYSKDGTMLHVVDDNPLRSLSINALTGARLTRQEAPANPQPKKCFGQNRLFMAVIRDHRVDLYQKVDKKIAVIENN